MAETVQIPIRDLGRYMRELGASFGPALLKGLTEAAIRAEATLVSEGDRKGVKNLGLYKAGWSRGTAMRLGEASASIRVFNNMPYSGVVELGRRAGRKMPWLRETPIDRQPIYLWCKSKLGMTDEEAAKAAKPIAWSIKRKGIKGKFVLRDVLGQLAKDGAEEVAKSLQRGMRKVMRARARAELPPRGGGP